MVQSFEKYYITDSLSSIAWKDFATTRNAFEQVKTVISHQQTKKTTQVGAPLRAPKGQTFSNTVKGCFMKILKNLTAENTFLAWKGLSHHRMSEIFEKNWPQQSQ